MEWMLPCMRPQRTNAIIRQYAREMTGIKRVCEESASAMPSALPRRMRQGSARYRRCSRRALLPRVRGSFKIGDHVTWNSEAGYVSGTVIAIHTRDLTWKGYVHHATRDEPQYEIRSDRTDHIALHKGSALVMFGARRHRRSRQA